LSYDTDGTSLKTAFGAHGAVEEAVVIMDRDTNRSKGFGFVTMPQDTEGTAAMAALDGKEMDGRTIKVNEAKPQAERNTSGAGFGGSRY
jgi:RNA recognition motif-containing protein